MAKRTPTTFIGRFLALESSGGILLMIAAVIALVLANTPLQPYYNLLIDTPVEIRVGPLELAKPLLLWINDGLMAIFFFLVGLELKRELLEGELSDRSKIILPAVGAVGGMALPALIYLIFNAGDPPAMKGWAIPAATDIAFALGILSLLGSRVPRSIKVFLTSLAIFDDIGAILIIAVFYTDKIVLGALLVVSLCIALLFYLNSRRVESRTMYILVGVVMWIAMVKSGVHATLTGVILAMFIPMRSWVDENYSPLRNIEDDLHSAVAYIILPIFAFANAGIKLAGIGIEELLNGVPLGIAAGLFLGKQLGIFSLIWLAAKLKLTSLPEEISWGSLYGAAALCGVGFTMSLFIGSLAFEETGINLLFDERLGIILGSLVSGLLGYFILRKSLPASSSEG